MIRLPVPPDLDTAQLAVELADAGYVLTVDDEQRPPHVTVVDNELVIVVDGLADTMPAAEDRDACESQEDLNFLLWVTAEAAHDADIASGIAASVAGVVDAHEPTVAPPPSPLDRLAAAVGLTPDDMAAAIREATSA